MRTNAGKKDIAVIRSAVRKLEAFAVKKVKTLAGYKLLELEFHQAIVKPSGDQILALVNVALKNYFNVAFRDDNASSDSSMAMMSSTIERELLERRRNLRPGGEIRDEVRQFRHHAP